LQTLALASASGAPIAVKQAFYRLADEKREIILVQQVRLAGCVCAR
jgi:hypothetical protein